MMHLGRVQKLCTPFQLHTLFYAALPLLNCIFYNKLINIRKVLNSVTCKLGEEVVGDSKFVVGWMEVWVA
jgi:hypothetical protein